MTVDGFFVMAQFMTDPASTRNVGRVIHKLLMWSDIKSMPAAIWNPYFIRSIPKMLSVIDANYKNSTVWVSTMAMRIGQVVSTSPILLVILTDDKRYLEPFE